jgi:hypothetical protein
MIIRRIGKWEGGKRGGDGDQWNDGYGHPEREIL